MHIQLQPLVWAQPVEGAHGIWSSLNVHGIDTSAHVAQTIQGSKAMFAWNRTAGLVLHVTVSHARADTPLRAYHGSQRPCGRTRRFSDCATFTQPLPPSCWPRPGSPRHSRT